MHFTIESQSGGVLKSSSHANASFVFLHNFSMPRPLSQRRFISSMPHAETSSTSRSVENRMDWHSYAAPASTLKTVDTIFGIAYLP